MIQKKSFGIQLVFVLMWSVQSFAQVDPVHLNTASFPDSNFIFQGSWSPYAFGHAESWFDYAFISEGKNVEVYQTHNPNDIFHRTTVSCRGEVQDMTSIRGALYTAEGEAGISVIATNNSSTIRVVNIPDLHGSIISVDAKDDILIAGSENGRIHVLDVNDPQNPVPLGYVETPRGQLEKVVLGNAIVVTKCADGLYYFNYHDLSIQEHIYTDHHRSPVIDLALWNEFVLLARENMTLDFVNISNPDSIWTHETIFYRTPITSIFVEGDDLYASFEGSGLEIFDLMQPLQDATSISLPLQEDIQDLALTSSNVLVTTSAISGVSILELSLDSQLSTIGYCSTPGEGLAMTLEGDRAYLADGEGLSIIDISDPEFPEIVSFKNLGQHMINLCVNGDQVLVAGELDGLFILDISDEEFPDIVGNYMGEGEIMDVAVYENYAYVASGGMGMRVVDISDPADPFEHSLLSDEWDMSFAVEIKDTLLAFGSDGDLLIYNISDPENPVLMNNSIFAYEISDIQFYNDRIYMASGDGLKIIDIQEPTQAQILSSWEYFAEPMFGKVHATGSQVFLPSFEGIDIINCADPLNPYQEGSIPTMESWDVASSGPNIFISATFGFTVMGAGTHHMIEQRGGPFEPLDMMVSGIHTLIAGGDAGLIYLDATDPGNITRNEFDFERDALALSHAGDYAYAMSSDGNFRALGLGTTSVYLLGSADIGAPSDGFAMDTRDETVVVGTAEGYVQFLDCSSRYNIDLMGGVYLYTSGIPELVLLDTMALVGVGNEFFSINITSLETPEIIHRTDLDGEVIALTEKALFTISKETRLSIAQWDHMGVPEVVYSELELGFAPDFAYSEGNNFYLGKSSHSEMKLSWIMALDITDTGNPMIVGGASFSGQVGTLTAHESKVYLTTMSDDLLVFENAAFAPVSLNPGWSTPKQFKLAQNYPNPFNPSTILAYEVAKASEIILAIYSINGQLVQTLVSETKAAGSYEVMWQGRDRSGKPVSTGLYMARFQAGDFSSVVKMLYLK
ncbi:MAG: T9SS type A sorting domain-containing protein [FCB group bacterium]|nr:T9SS type A sorting domain-containing protein [FCB group bacterium]MBL7028294.1 T9SS type A sorting domain-containing protein [Candidatus Neomarinimicrobiota bacterium]MBL7121613.1 T9SS type A sorting domain-containing protein [Candidatus Neomarinimicrobiota bacterium]